MTRKHTGMKHANLENMQSMNNLQKCAENLLCNFELAVNMQDHHHDHPSHSTTVGGESPADSKKNSGYKENIQNM